MWVGALKEEEEAGESVGIHGPFCWGSRKAHLVSYGEKLVWVDVRLSSG